MRLITKYAALALALMVAIVPRLEAATGTLAPSPYLSVFDANGNPVSGGCIWTFTAGTSTPVATYTDKAVSVANSNPIIADAAGQFVAYLIPGQSYKFTFEAACTPPAHGAVLRTQDNIDAVPASAASLDVTGVAGETITAGMCAYLSDGSGAKAAGSWFKCDSTNTYSSITPEIGLVPSTITIGQSGTIRQAGAVPGLSALTIGAEYFVSTAGTLTITAPALARHIGHADTATSMVVSGNPDAPANLSNGIDDFRLTLTTAVPVTTSDVTAATTLFCSPYTGTRIALFNSTGIATVFTSAEFSIAVPATTSQMYDVFAFANGATPTLELLAWTNDTTRATALVRTTTGVWTKSGDLTRRYLGSVRTSTVSGQTTDSLASRLVWNYYNRVERTTFKVETTSSWAGTNLGTYRQLNNSTANQVEVVIGVVEEPIYLSALAIGTSTAIGVPMGISVGVDSTTTPPAIFQGGMQLSVVVSGMVVMNPVAWYVPTAGRHLYQVLEVEGAGSSTFFGSSNASFFANAYNPGIVTRHKG